MGIVPKYADLVSSHDPFLRGDQETQGFHGDQVGLLGHPQEAQVIQIHLEQRE